MIIIDSFKKRKPWVAALISLFLGGSTGMLYLGRGKRGLFYLGLELLCLILPLIAAHFHPVAISPEDILAISMLILKLIEVSDCYIQAKKFDPESPIKWFSRWYNLILLLFVLPIVIPLILRTFLYEPFNIPAGSMRPTLEIGEYVMAKKYTYGYGPYSFPLGIGEYLLNDKIFSKSPERGDVVIFRLPTDTDVNFIKRVIALPGESIHIRKGKVYLNGAEIPQTSVRQVIITNHIGDEIEATIYQEALPNGKSYEIMDSDPNGELDNTQIFTVPAGHYFVMGDNRDNSRDSRVMNSVGFVPEINIVSKAGFIFWNEYTHEISYKPIQ